MHLYNKDKNKGNNNETEHADRIKSKITQIICLRERIFRSLQEQ